MWRVVHVTLSEEGCVRCGGDLEQMDDGLELLPLAGRERRFSIPSPPRRAGTKGVVAA